MGDRRKRYCRNCGLDSREEDIELSWTRLCPRCGRELMVENIDGLKYKAGEPLLRWRRAMAASVGGVLLDDAPDQE